MKRSLLAMLALWATPTLGAGERTTEQWIIDCKSPNPVEHLICLHYLQGMGDLNSIVRDDAKVFCPPNGVTLAQLARIAVKFAEANPEAHHLPFHVIAARAFRVAFPCAGQR